MLGRGAAFSTRYLLRTGLSSSFRLNGFTPGFALCRYFTSLSDEAPEFDITQEFDIDEFLSNPDEVLFSESNSSLLDNVPTASKVSEHGIRLFLATKMAFLEPLLVSFHQFSGLPYWGSIFLFSSLIKLALTPLTMYVSSYQVRLHKYQHQIQAYQEAKNESSDLQREFHVEEEKKFLKAIGVQSWKKLLMFLPMAAYVPMFFSLRHMVHSLPALKAGGALWFENLAACDPYFILPIINSLLMLMNMRLASKTMERRGVYMPPFLKWVHFGVVGLTTFFTIKFSAAMFMFWIPMQLMTLVTNQLTDMYYKKQQHEV